MNGERIIEKVVRAVQDSSMTGSDDVLELLIEGHRELMRETFNEVMITSDTVDTVVTDPLTTHLSMPSDFSHELFSCSDQEPKTNYIRVINSLGVMLAKFGSLAYSGIPTHVCLSGSSLVIQPVPAEVRTLTLHYYRQPVDLTLETEPEAIPPHLHKILEYYACWRLWSDIEDGDEGGTPNTIKFEGLFERYKKQFIKETPRGRSRQAPPVVREESM